MKYGYVRVSSQTQNIARQMEEMYKLGLTDDVIFVDRQSGKDFDRTSYKILKSKLKQGDLLIIKSIDRLGRNYDMIINEWQDITKVIIPEGVTTIGEHAFYENEELTSLVIPETVTYIDPLAIEECDNLENVHYLGKKEQFEKLNLCLDDTVKMTYAK